jgi:hypothetical protein
LKPRIYIDTSVIGGCEDDEFSLWSIRLFDEFRKGLKTAVICRSDQARAGKSARKCENDS